MKRSFPPIASSSWLVLMFFQICNTKFIVPDSKSCKREDVKQNHEEGEKQKDQPRR